MSLILWITTAVLAMHAAHSYILLTANLEDVQAIAKQLVDSPVADQIKQIWRRASNQFAMQVAKARRPGGYRQRADDEEENNSLNKEHSQDEAPEDDGANQRRQGSDVDNLDTNTTQYLSMN